MNNGNSKKSSSQKHINDPAECQQQNESKNAAIINNSVKSSFKTSQHVIDEYAHPNNNNVRLPRTYGDLQAKYTVAIRKDKTCTG